LPGIEEIVAEPFWKSATGPAPVVFRIEDGGRAAWESRGASGAALRLHVLHVLRVTSGTGMPALQQWGSAA